MPSLIDLALDQIVNRNPYVMATAGVAVMASLAASAVNPNIRNDTIDVIGNCIVMTFETTKHGIFSAICHVAPPVILSLMLPGKAKAIAPILTVAVASKSVYDHWSDRSDEKNKDFNKPWQFREYNSDRNCGSRYYRSSYSY
jgi:hypothetical protein